MQGNLLLILLLLPFVGSLCAVLAPANMRHGEAWLSGAVAVAGLAIVTALRPAVVDGGVVRKPIGWLPSFGLDFTLRMDGFAWIFVVLIMGIGLLVVLYARYYLSPRDPAARFYGCLLAFMGAMTGIVVAGNLIVLIVFWELTSLFSFLLIGYWHQSTAARDGARMALIVTGSGGLCLLAGLLLIGHMAGSYDLDAVLAAGDRIRGHALYLPALALVLIGAFAKSAQFPFHFWLPNAMAAPTPVSAYLHSATMVKAGVFLMVRLWPALAGTDEWFWMVGLAGMATFLLGAFLALFQHDLKGLLAYSTISHLGLITTLAGIGTPLAIVAAVFHIMNHAVFKASLFMAAGIIDHECGTRDMRRLSGLRHAMPYTAALAIVASAAMAGVPLLNGFLSKEMFFAEAFETGKGSLLDPATTWVALLASAFSVAYSLRFIHTVFFGGPPPVDLPREPHEPPRWMRFPVEILVIICLVVGVAPAATVGPYLHMAAVSVLGPATPTYSLALWHGVNAPLLMSVVALAGGVLLYAFLATRLAEGPEGPPLLRLLKGQRLFERSLVTLWWTWPRALYRFAGTERLQPQLRILVVLAFAVAAWSLWGTDGLRVRRPADSFDPIFALVWLAGAACAIGAAWQAKYHRFAALALLGGAGVVTCVTFAWFSAPDVAMTQLLVEIVTTVLLVLGLRWLPKRLEAIAGDVELPARLRRSADLVVAIACGAGIAAVSHAVMTRPLASETAGYYLEHAYSQGGGTNVVNVILVDFRAFDTFGEITVLGVVGLTVFALLRRFRPARESVEAPEQQLIQRGAADTDPGRAGGVAAPDYLRVPGVIMQWMFPAIIMLSTYLFLRGHDLPGGGFAAGVALAIGFLLQYLASNVRWVEDRLRILPVRWMGVGLLTAAATGAGSWLFGYPFLTAHARYLELPIVGKVPAATALLFDLGVFALVVGATVVVLVSLAHQSLRAERARVSGTVRASAGDAEVAEVQG
jgi:multicomponent K+:H+ antiporter subunit A